MPKDKYFDTLLHSAFMAGAAVGQRHVTPQAEEDAYRTWRDSWAGRPHEGTDPYPEVPKASVVRDLLSLVADEFPRDDVFLQEILGWDVPTRQAVVAWAGAVHLRASDNDDVVVPPLPAVLAHERLGEPLPPPGEPIPPGHYTVSQEDLATRLGHPGGHYG